MNLLGFVGESVIIMTQGRSVMKKLFVIFGVILSNCILLFSCATISTTPNSAYYKILSGEEKKEYEKLYEEGLNEIFVEVQRQNLGDVRFQTVSEYKSWESTKAAVSFLGRLGAGMQGAANAPRTTIGHGSTGGTYTAPYQDSYQDERKYYLTLYNTAKQIIDEYFDGYYRELKNE